MPKAFENLLGSAYALAILASRRGEGFRVTGGEAEAIVFFWWAGSCERDAQMAAVALCLVEEHVQGTVGANPAGPFEGCLSEAVALLADVARAEGYTTVSSSAGW